MNFLELESYDLVRVSDVVRVRMQQYKGAWYVIYHLSAGGEPVEVCCGSEEAAERRITTFLELAE